MATTTTCPHQPKTRADTALRLGPGDCERKHCFFEHWLANTCASCFGCASIPFIATNVGIPVLPVSYAADFPCAARTPQPCSQCGGVTNFTIRVLNKILYLDCKFDTCRLINPCGD